MFTQEEVSYRLYQQTGFLVGDPGSGSGKILPSEAGFNVGPSANKLDNNQVQADGVKRRFGRGNRMAKATGGAFVYNLNFLGYLLKAICSTLTSVSFGGVLSITVTNGGSGYTSAPTINFTGGGGSGATAVAIVLGGTIVAIIVTNPGTGYTTAPTVGFTGGAGTGAAATAVIDNTKYQHTGTLTPGAPLYHILEKGAGSALWRRYFNQVLNKLSFDESTEGLCTVTPEWAGSGHQVKTSSPLDGAPTEITGTPGEYGALVLIEGASVAGVLRKMTTDCTVNVVEKRPTTAQSGKASELRKGAVAVSGQIEAYFEDETLADKSEQGTITQLQSVITSPDGVFSKLLPEVELAPDGDWSRSTDGVIFKGGYESVKVSSAIAPIQFRLVNSTSSY